LKIQLKKYWFQENILSLKLFQLVVQWKKNCHYSVLITVVAVMLS
jgi:hypothetical protein